MRDVDGLVIRAAELPADQDAILALYSETAQWHASSWPGRFRVPDIGAIRAALESADGIGGEDHYLRLAAVDGRVVGLISANAGPAPSGGMEAHRGSLVWVGDVIVTSEFRGRGIGEQLMRGVQEWARERGAAHVTLQVYSDNAAARSLYAKLGYSDTDVKMVLDL